MSKYWLVRLGPGGKYLNQALEGSYIALGFEECPDLSILRTLKSIKKQLNKVYPDYNTRQLGIQSGQIFAFYDSMSEGDYVITPTKARTYIVAVVKEYFYVESPEDDCPFKHRRKVIWQDRSVEKQSMSPNLNRTLATGRTIYNLDQYSSELQDLISIATKGEKIDLKPIRDVIQSALYGFDPKDFERFIANLFESFGYTASETRYVGDKGIDVIGTLNAEGVAEVNVQIQVKRIKGKVGAGEIRNLRGSLKQGDMACFVTSSDFTPHAREEAEEPGKIRVMLIDGIDLTNLILKYFDGLNEEFKSKLGIQRKKNINLEENFEILNA